MASSEPFPDAFRSTILSVFGLDKSSTSSPAHQASITQSPTTASGLEEMEEEIIPDLDPSLIIADTDTDPTSRTSNAQQCHPFSPPVLPPPAAA
jgi:hypothetical protein